MRVAFTSDRHTERLVLHPTERPAQDAQRRTDAGRRLIFLEVVRGLAATMVVIEHLLILRLPAYETFTFSSFSLGRAGIVAFFLVSGYVIPLSLRGQDLRTFARRRFFRLFPTYWVALGLLLLLTPTQLEQTSGTSLAVNIVMLQSLLGMGSLLYPAWTLSLELVFYVQAAVAKGTGHLDRSVHLGWLWLGAYLGMCLTERVLGRDLPTTFPLLLFCASLGHAVHLREQGSGTWRPMLGAAVIAVPVGSLLSVDGGVVWTPQAQTLSFFAGLVLFVGMAGRRRDSTVPPFLLWLGACSYAIYVLHPVVGHFLADVVGLTDPLLALAELPVLALAAHTMHKYIELPSIRLGRRAPALRD